MSNETKVNIPSVSDQEVVQAANGLAAFAKRRFLEGFADEAATLADRAAALIDRVDTGAQHLLKQFADKCRAHAPVVTPPAPTAPATAPTEPPAQ